MSLEKLEEIYLAFWQAYCREPDRIKRSEYGSLYCEVKAVHERRVVAGDG